MYCKKCNIVVHGVGHDICPKCNDRLEPSQELLHAESGDAIDWQKLKDLISDIDAAAEPTKKLKTDKEREALFALGKTLSTEDTRLQHTAAVSAERVEKSASGFTRAKDIPDIAAKGFAPEPAPQPVLNQNPKYGMMNSLFIIFAVLIVAGVAAAYYLFFIESEPAKQAFVLFEKTEPVRVPQAQTDKKNLILKPTVQAHKSADSRQPEPDKKDASQPMAVAVSKTAAPPARKAGTLSPAIKEKHAEPAQASASIEEKQAQFPSEEKKVIAPPQQKAAANTTMYCINVASCKLKESADAVIKDLQKKGYEPALDSVTVKGATWYRVTLGHFKTQGDAKNYARELQSRGNIKGFVVKKKY